MSEWIGLIMGTVAALLPIANPFSTAPVFATLTLNYGELERNRQARRAAMNMGAVLLVTLFVGALVLAFFGIGIPAVRIAGGILIARIGFSMLNINTQERVSDESKHEAEGMRDISFTPIAMPLLSGPGSMAVVLSMATVAESPLEYGGISIGIMLVVFISWLILRSSTLVVAYLGVTGMNALTSVMGFLLVCIGVTFIGHGVVEGLSNEQIMGPIVDAIRQAI